MPPTIPPALTTAARVLRENLSPEDLAEVTKFAWSTIADARDYRFGDDPATLEEIAEPDDRDAVERYDALLELLTSPPAPEPR
jgi:hypothetical protein